MTNFVLEYGYGCLWALLLALSFWVVVSRNLIVCVALLAIFSLIVAGLFTYMQAPDVAITEAAIGAAISTIFYLIGIFIVGKEVKNAPRRPVVNAVICFLAFILMFKTVAEMPQVGDKDSPANSYVAKHYIERTKPDVGVENMVTAVLASYRGFDTLGEVFVIFTAGVAVTMLLGTMRSRPRRIRKKAKEKLKRIKAAQSFAVKKIKDKTKPKTKKA